MPFVRIKLASSIDGKIAMASGESKWITNELSRADVQIMRAQSGAIMTGMGTLLTDNPKLTARPLNYHYAFKQPYRVVLDKNLDTPLDANIIGCDGLCIIVTQKTENTKKINELSQQGVTVLQLDFSDIYTTLQEILKYLAGIGVNDVMVEAGPRLVSQFIKFKLLDELVVYTAPCLMGLSANSMTIIELAAMAERIQFKLQSINQFDSDIKSTYRLLQENK